jgi:large subunit ribosomal protein L19
MAEATTTTEEIKQETIKREIPELRPGQTIRVYQKIKEISGEEGKEKERVQIFEGVIIAEGGKGISRTITVRKISEGIGVEKIFPIHLPTITKIEIVKEGKTRRAKLLFLRNPRKKLKEKIVV